MATVWKARQLSLDRPVAIKILDASLASDADDVRRFTDEARAAARLRHPGIVQVFEAGTSHGLRYFVMELVSGYTVGEWLRRKRHGLGEQQALVIGEYVVAALDYAYSTYRMIHCDIKPDNIMIHGDGTVKLTDLGLARMKVAGSSDSETDILGTPAYMSPEQARGEQNLDCRSDIYSLGATLYHIATGKILFRGHGDEEVMALQQSGTVPDAMEIDPSISAPFCQLLEKMMAKDKHNRQPNWAAVARDIKLVAARKSLPWPVLPKGQSTMECCPARAEMMAAHMAATARVFEPKQKSSIAGRLLLLALFAAIAFAGVKVYRAWHAWHEQQLPYAVPHKPASGDAAQGQGSGAPRLHADTPQATDAATASGDGHSSAPKKPQPPPDPEALRRYRAAIEWIRSNPDNSRGAIEILRGVEAVSGDAPEVAEAVRKKISEIEKEQEYQLERARVSLASRAGDLADWGLYDRAVAVYDEYEGPCALELSEWRIEQAATLRRKAGIQAKSQAFPRIRACAASKAPVHPPSPQVQKDADEFFGKLARTTLEDGMPFALSALEAKLAESPALGSSPEIAKVAQIFTAYADAPSAYLARYSKRIDEEAWIKELDNTFEGVVVNVDGDGVALRIAPKKKPVHVRVIPFSKLHPDDRIRVIGGDGTMAGKLLLGLQFAHARKAQQARAQFESLQGPFGEALIEAFDKAQ